MTRKEGPASRSAAGCLARAVTNGIGQGQPRHTLLEALIAAPMAMMLASSCVGYTSPALPGARAARSHAPKMQGDDSYIFNNGIPLTNLDGGAIETREPIHL